MIEHKHMKFMAITTIVILVGFGLWLLVTAYLLRLIAPPFPGWDA